MKTRITIMLMLAVAVMYGCQSSSPRGGGSLEGSGFKIQVPRLATKIEQGAVKTIAISLDRDKYFKEDVDLEIESPEHIVIDPNKATIKSSDVAKLNINISIAENAPIGEYHVTVRGIPATGTATATDFNVKVVAP